jgi:hypothetical protein
MRKIGRSACFPAAERAICMHACSRAQVHAVTYHDSQAFHVLNVINEVINIHLGVSGVKLHKGCHCAPQLMCSSLRRRRNCSPDSTGTADVYYSKSTSLRYSTIYLDGATPRHDDVAPAECVRRRPRPSVDTATYPFQLVCL